MAKVYKTKYYLGSENCEEVSELVFDMYSYLNSYEDLLIMLEFKHSISEDWIRRVSLEAFSLEEIRECTSFMLENNISSRG